MDTEWLNIYAFTQAIRLIETNPSLSILSSIVRGRRLQKMSCHIGREGKFFENLSAKNQKLIDKYVDFTVSKNVFGTFETKKDVPEEYKSSVIPPDRKWWINSDRNRYWLVDTVKMVDFDLPYAETLVYQEETLSNGLNITYNKSEKIDWWRMCKDVVSGCLDLSSLDIDYSNQTIDMLTSFNSEILNIKDKTELVRLCGLFDIEMPENINIAILWNLLCNLEQKLFLSSPTVKSKIETQRPCYFRQPNSSAEQTWLYLSDSNYNIGSKIATTQERYLKQSKVSRKKDDKIVIEYKTQATDEQRVKLPNPLDNLFDYEKTVMSIAEIRSNMKNIFTSEISTKANRISHTGLVTFHKQSSDHATAAFVIFLKNFGHLPFYEELDHWLKSYLELLETKYLSSTDFVSIFLAMPCMRTVSHVPQTELIEIYNLALSWLRVIAEVLKEQWDLGVFKTESGKRIYPDTWNTCARAWGILLRYIQIIKSHVPQGLVQQVQLFKVVEILNVRIVDSDYKVFKMLTLGSDTATAILPWDGLNTLRDDFVSVVETACTTHSVKAEKWFGGKVE